MFRKSCVTWAAAAGSPQSAMTHSVPVVLERSAVLGKKNVTTTSSPSMPVQRVVILPILHAANSQFFDNTLLKLHQMVRGNPVMPPTKEGEQPPDVLTSMPSTLLGRKCQGFLHTVVVEGVNGSEADVNMQRSEWLRASTNPEDAEKLVAAAQTYASHFQDLSEEATQVATPFDEIMKNYCKEYSLKFPLPPGILLEDYFFKPLLAVSMGHCLVNSDVILSNIPPTLRQLVAQAGLGSPALSAYRNSRFVDSVLDGLNMSGELERPNSSGDSGGAPETAAQPTADTGMKAGLSTEWDSAAFPEGRQVTALWGHAHVPRVVELLKGLHGFRETSIESTKSKVSGEGGATELHDVSDFVTATVPYGWNPATHMVK